jgi:RsgA GTPase
VHSISRSSAGPPSSRNKFNRRSSLRGSLRSTAACSSPTPNGARCASLHGATSRSATGSASPPIGSRACCAIVRNAAGREVAAQVLAANVDVALLVTALGADLEPRRRGRYLVAVWQSGASLVIVLTKSDLQDDAAEQALAVEHVAVGVPVHLVSAIKEASREPTTLRAASRSPRNGTRSDGRLRAA